MRQAVMALSKGTHVALLLWLFLTTCAALLPTPPVPTYPPSRFMTKKYEVVHGYRMAYVEVGEGDPIVFLHGNPTSSFIWRNIMPYLEGRGRLIAPDLIGMGDSDKLPPDNQLRYNFFDQANFLYTLLDQLGVHDNVMLVIHDWGSALGFTWAFLNRFRPNAVVAIAFMESITRPLDSAYTEPFVIHRFDPFRSPRGEYLVLIENEFVTGMDSRGMLRSLSDSERAEYLRPYLNPGEDRRPTLTWPRDIPINGFPSDVTDVVSTYSQWLANCTIPKLFIRAVPGFFSSPSFAGFVRTWPNTVEVVVRGIHFVQEDSPDAIGGAIVQWLDSLSNVP